MGGIRMLVEAKVDYAKPTTLSLTAIVSPASYRFGREFNRCFWALRRKKK